ncbi:DUF5375 family protein [Serratia nevei]|uniref:DUF5375 family protein n=1 Tax=Serratia nevei TaxID=2703794 RepID=UPI003FA7C39E
MTLDNGSASCIPLEVRTALFRRAVAEAYLAACAAQGMTLPHTLDSLQMLIASNIEALFVKLHGVDKGMAIACSLLGDMVARTFCWRHRSSRRRVATSWRSCAAWRSHPAIRHRRCIKGAQ